MPPLHVSTDDPDTVAACPDCDSTGVHRRGRNATPGATYRCDKCGSRFDEYTERERDHGVRGDTLAGKLANASPEDLEADD